jgi:hypothetical protein
MTLATALSFRFDFCAAAMEVIGTRRVFQNPTIIIFARRVALVRACQIGGIDGTKCFGERRPDLAVVDRPRQSCPQCVARPSTLRRTCRRQSGMARQ